MTSSKDTSQEEHAPRNHRRQLFIIIGIVVVVILGILAIPYYQNYIAPFNRTVITVDGQKITMRYFIDRAVLAGADPMSMLQTLTEEKVIEIAAPQYGVVVTDEDIEKELRSAAAGDAETISDIEFKEWYRQKLNDSHTNDKMYKQLVRSSLLASRMQSYLADLTPSTAEQIHLHTIVVGTYEDAQKVEDRLKAGEDFAAVAKEASLDTSSKDNGGDVGWLPPVLLANFQSVITSLEINEVSDPLAYYDTSSASSSSSGSSTPSAYYIFKVSEKDSNRELSEQNLQYLKNEALTLWLPDEINRHSIQYNFNSEIYAWINWQIEKQSTSNTSGSSSTNSSTSGN